MGRLKQIPRGRLVAFVLVEAVLIGCGVYCAARAIHIHATYDGLLHRLDCVYSKTTGRCLEPVILSPFWWQVVAGGYATLAGLLAIATLVRLAAARGLVLLNLLTTGSFLGFTALAGSSEWLMTNDSRWAWTAASLLLGVALVVLVETTRQLRQLRALRALRAGSVLRVSG